MGAREDLLSIPNDVLRSGRIAQAVLVFMDFKDNPRRWWTGFGDLRASGETWQGVGDLIGVDGLESSYSSSARNITFSVAATQEMLALALAAEDQVIGRGVQVFLQLYTTESVITPAGEQYPGNEKIGSPMSLFTGTMEAMPYGGAGTTERRIEVEAWGLWLKRNSVPRGQWTDSDQRARYPTYNDRGFERLPLYVNYETGWRS